MIFSLLFYSGKKHISTHKETVFECIRWAQNNPGNPHALVLMLNEDDDSRTIEFRIKWENGKRHWKQIKTQI